MYRCDASRSGATASAVPDTVAAKWSTEIGGRLTQPVIVGDTVFVAVVDTHTVYALSADNGQPRWHFTAGGRVDSSPTVYQGTVLFGSADGWVYCLRADNGQLAWRFRAAPEERLISAYGQLESVWSVHGAVLVQNDTLYVTAGRTSYTDGGIVLYRLNPATGEQLSRTVLYHLDPETGKQLTSEAKFNMEGTGSDILSGDGESVFLKYFCFDADGQRSETKKPHLWSITGFLGEDWYVRSYWIFGDESWAGWGGWATAANTFPSGRILAFDDQRVYGYGRAQVAGGPTGHRAETYHLFSSNKQSPAPPDVTVDKRGRKRVTRRKPPYLWSQPQELIVRALALAGDRLVVAGPVDVGEKAAGELAYENETDALAALAGRKGSYLHIVSAADGQSRSAQELPAPPVFDGLSVARGKIYVSLKNGDVACYAAAE
jgi:outer membrane protein assembly factor BamB